MARVETTRPGPVERAARGVRGDVRAMAAEASPWVERLARLGYAAKGVVYLMVGVLAARAAFGAGGETTDSRGAIGRIAEQPFGRAMLAVVGLGLIGYALWKAIDGILDPERHGTDAKGLARRAGSLVTAVIYGGLGLAAFRIVAGAGGGGEGGAQATQSATARLMAKPFGPWLVGLIGLAVVVWGIRRIRSGLTKEFRRRFGGGMSPVERTWADRAGTWGLAAHGLVLGIIGLFLVRAALRTDPSQARGVEGVLDAVAAQPYGPLLLGLVALGLIAFGVYNLVLARYGRLAPVQGAL